MYTNQHEKSSCCLCLSRAICFIILLDDICVLFDIMMTMMMDTARLEMDSDKHLCISIPETNPKNFDDINNNYYPKDKEIFDCHSTMKSNVLSSDKHENDTTLLTTTTMTTTVEVKVKTTKTSSPRKRKLDLVNSNNEDEHQEQINKQAAISKNKVINLFFFRTRN